jgi:flagellar basal-body rod modification protein FlgD
MVTSTVPATTSATDTTAASAAMKKEIGLNKDDFMKLFIAQLQNQDPLSPQDPTQFLSQLAQMTQVEQAYNTNTALQNLITAQNSAMGMNAVSFVGGTVKAKGNAIAFDGTAPASIQFNLPAATTATSVTIRDAAGRVVRTVNIGPEAAGDITCTWDGRDNSGNLVPAGAYSYAVSNTAASGSTVTATTYTTGRVDGVGFANGTPSLTIGAVSVGLSDIVSVKGGV